MANENNQSYLLNKNAFQPTFLPSLFAVLLIEYPYKSFSNREGTRTQPVYHMQGIVFNESNQLQGYLDMQRHLQRIYHIEAETKCPPLYQHGLTLIPAWISYDMPNKVWNEITYPFNKLQCL